MASLSPGTQSMSGGSSSLPAETAAVPTLKVMRLQKPDLHVPSAGTFDVCQCIVGTALCLPDSFGVIHVGETFTAYLGAINVNKTLPVTQLTVTAQLQTPSQRWHLASRLDEGNAAGGVDVPPESGVDTIVSHALEEVGQHILRVEVGYGTSDGGTKSLRKFYRFQVSNPLLISETTYRTGDTSCFVSISLHNNGDETKRGITISSADFEAAPGLIVERMKESPSMSTTPSSTPIARGVSLFDNCGRLDPGATRKYLFKVTTQSVASSTEGSTKGIAAGDELGKGVFTWRKACGEMGRIATSPVICPMLQPHLDPNNPVATMRGEESDFVVHVLGSCLSVDVATMAAARAANPMARNVQRDRNDLDLLLPVTVEPVYPPKCMKLGVPCAIRFFIVNHSDRYLTLQLQFRSDHMKSVSVCGPSFKNLEEIAGNGGNTSVEMRFIALAPGLLKLRGCCVVDLATGLAIPQPPLFDTFVEAETKE